MLFPVRAQPELVESVYREWQSAGHDYKFDIQDFYEMTNAAFNYMWLIKKWTAAFGQDSVIVKVYDKSLFLDGITNYLLEDIDPVVRVSTNATMIHPSLDVGYSHVVALIDRELGRDFLQSEERKRMIVSLKNVSGNDVDAGAIEIAKDELVGSLAAFVAACGEPARKNILKEIDASWLYTISLGSR